ncbi:MAG: alpha-galactosidase [Armatimonadota bacterium]|nr:alpha-galactosidase [Armatimonadota bacterium]MDW8024630.1 alpha-galactosidase [Armatimonadota bacterium]
MAKGIDVMLDEARGVFSISHCAIGMFAQGFIAAYINGKKVHSSMAGSRFEVIHRSETSLTIKWHTPVEELAPLRLLFQIDPLTDTVQLTIASEDEFEGAVEVHGELFMGSEPYLGRLHEEENFGIFSLAHGPVMSKTAKTLFNRFNDTAVTLPKSEIYHEPGDPPYRYRFVSKGAVGEVVFIARVTTNVIKRHGIRYYAPIDKSVFTRAPTGWCSWYYYYQSITQEEWERNVEWLANNLRDFGLEWVQLDDGWQLDNGNPKTSGGRDWRGPNEKFTKGMKWVADIVKQRGMKPGIWLIPQKTDSDEVYNEHPDWFLRKPDGTPVRIGDWHPRKVESYVVDPTNPEALEYIKRLFHTLAHDWGFEYFKIDNQPEFSRWYDEQTDARRVPETRGSDAYRMTLKAIREAIGPNKYLLGCYGIPLDGIGIMNGSRTGGDMEASWQGCQVMIRTITKWGFLNNVVWWCDPDTLCVREPLTLGEARIMATLVSLSGQALMTSDKMYELPEERVEILRRVIPTVDIHPMEFYPWDEDKIGRPKIIDLKVAKHYGSWDVVAVFNWQEEPEMIEVDFTKLGLSVGNGIRYHVFEFWSKQYEGQFESGFSVTLPIRTCEVFAIRKSLGHPQLISASRHITQGIVDIVELVWDESNNELHGSSLLVRNDPYRLYFHVPTGFTFSKLIAEPRKSQIKTKLECEGELLITEMISSENQQVDWVIRFVK